MLTGSFKAGQLIGALESHVKHAQCFDMALMEDGSIVLASKDYRLYIYRYVKVIADESIKKFMYRNFYDFVNFSDSASYLIALCAQAPGVGAA